MLQDLVCIPLIFLSYEGMVANQIAGYNDLEPIFHENVQLSFVFPALRTHYKNILSRNFLYVNLKFVKNVM